MQSKLSRRWFNFSVVGWTAISLGGLTAGVLSIDLNSSSEISGDDFLVVSGWVLTRADLEQAPANNAV